MADGQEESSDEFIVNGGTNILNHLNQEITALSIVHPWIYVLMELDSKSALLSVCPGGKV